MSERVLFQFLSFNTSFTRSGNLTIKMSLHVVTSPEKTQHCPYRTTFFVLQNSSRMAVLPVQANGAVVPGGKLLDHRPDNTPPSLSFEFACAKRIPSLFRTRLDKKGFFFANHESKITACNSLSQRILKFLSGYFVSDCSETGAAGTGSESFQFL